MLYPSTYNDKLTFNLPLPAWKLLRPELFSCFGFESLIMYRLRRTIRGAYLARDLFAQRHTGDKMRAAAQRF